MKSWRSTISGAVTSIAGLVLALNGGGVPIPKWLVITAGFVMAGGFGMLGLVSKDAAVHSTVAEVQESTIKTT